MNKEQTKQAITVSDSPSSDQKKTKTKRLTLGPQAVKMYAEGMGSSTIAKQLVCSRLSVLRWVKASGIKVDRMARVLLENAKRSQEAKPRIEARKRAVNLRKAAEKTAQRKEYAAAFYLAHRER